MKKSSVDIFLEPLEPIRASAKHRKSEILVLSFGQDRFITVE